MTQSSALVALIDQPVLVLSKAQPKREYLAAVALRDSSTSSALASIALSQDDPQRAGVVCRGDVSGLLFARFTYRTQRRAVESAHGIRGILRFGDRLAMLPEETDVALQSHAGMDEVVTIDSSLEIGQSCTITRALFADSR